MEIVPEALKAEGNVYVFMHAEMPRTGTGQLS